VDLCIGKDKRKGGTLYQHLRHRGKKYHRSASKRAGRGCIPNRVDMRERPLLIKRKG